MAIDFPNSPTTGDTYTAGGRTWQWDGTVWASYGNYPDPTVLKIDTGTNRVGINNTSPTTALDVTGDLTVSGKVDAPLPVSNKTASYTLAAGDEGTRIVMNNAGATTITVDDGVFSAGDTVWIHNIGAGTTTVTAGTATVNTAGSLDVGQWEGGSLYFTSASSAIFFRGGGAGVAYGTATGGTSSSITVDGDSYTLLTFTSSGTLTVTKAGVFDVLVVGGGGGGGTAGSLICGAGGAGGYRQFDKVYFDTNQTVVVGAGDAVNGYRGTGSRCGQPFVGGGGSTYLYLYGRNGASGAGGGYSTATGGQGDDASGNNGGGGGSGRGGGGGGAGAAGTNGAPNVGGAGGDGLDASAFRGESAGTTYYAGGGGGEGATTRGLGGLGGGGNGKDPSNASTAGATNTGGGGGADGSSGGSGIVLVRFKN